MDPSTTRRFPVQLALVFGVGILATVRAEANGETAQALRRVLADNALAISIPDASWTFELGEAYGPVLATMHSPNGVASANVQMPAGLQVSSLDQAKQLLQTALGQWDDYHMFSERTLRLDAGDGYEQVLSYAKGGRPWKSVLRLLNTGDATYIVRCMAPEDEYARFEATFARIAKSLEVVRNVEAESPDAYTRADEQRERDSSAFRALTVERTHTMEFSAGPERVFPLLEIGRTEPLLQEVPDRDFLFRSSGESLAGTLYATAAHGGPQTLWYVAEHDPVRWRFRYVIIYRDLEFQEIIIRCAPGAEPNTTTVSFVDRMTGLSKRGNLAIRQWTGSGKDKEGMLDLERQIKARLGNS